MYMMKTDNPLTAILDEEIDNIEDLNAKHQLVTVDTNVPAKSKKD